MSKGYINKETRILADDVNAPYIMGTGGVTDTVSENIADILNDRAEEISEEWTFTLSDETTVVKKVVTLNDV